MPIQLSQNFIKPTQSQMKDKIILSDIDGVVLDWEFAFSAWMEQQGDWIKAMPRAEFAYEISERYDVSKDQGRKLIRQFNESAAIGFLPPLRDARYYVKRLHEEHGYVFHCITSLSKDINAQRLREMNLTKLFGDTVFEEIICLDTGADKNEALEPYRGSGLWWIEDKIINCEVGADLGLHPLLMEHGHNLDYNNPAIPRVKNWREIYKIVTS